MKFHKNLKIKRTYLNVYESEKKLNKISNYYKYSGTKPPVKELSFLILPCPKHTGTNLSTHFQKYQNCYKE